MSKTRTASVYTRENEPPYAFRRVKEGQGHRTGSLTGPFYTRPFVNGKQRWNALVGAETFEQAKAMANKGVDVLNASAKGLVVEGVEDHGR